MKDIFKNSEKRWVRYCPICSKEVTHLRKNYCNQANLLKQPCIKCSNISNHPSGMFGDVRVAWYESFRKSALTRGYCWELTLEDIDKLYKLQNGLCALSNLPISWSTTKWEHTASIDRINNNFGYTKDNIQLVHKKINMMRGTLEVEEFINLCQSVADKVKW